MTPPLLIVGMHRSGTTLLSRFIDEINIFTGSRKDINNESEFFIKLNDWVLSQYNASWDNPYNFFFKNDELDKLIITGVKRSLRLVSSYRYWGLINTLKGNSFTHPNQPWGWKDPRTSITLRIWLKIFPDAKIIHIHRNPLDVAKSLQVRELNSDYTFNFKDHIKEYVFYPKNIYQQSARLTNLEEGVKLWIEYEKNILETLNKYRPKHLRLSYEEFMESPKKALADVMDFLGHSLSETKFDNYISQINSKRKNAFLDDSESFDFFKKFQDDSTVKTLGYSNLL